MLNKSNIEEVVEQAKYIDIYLSKKTSLKDGIGVVLFETINEIDFNNISLNFQKENIRIRIRKKNVNWTNYILRIFEKN